MAVALGFPPLLGIPSHISLANTIRQKHHERVCCFFSGDKLRSFMQLIALEKYAKWWIDNRVLDIDSIHKFFTEIHAGTAALQTNPQRLTEQIPAQTRKKSVIREGLRISRKKDFIITLASV